MPGKRVEAVLPPMVDPVTAAAAMTARVAAVGVESVPLEQAAGRVLAEAIHADRDSPAADHSAVDGYALHAEALEALRGRESALPEMNVAFEVVTGTTPPPLLPGQVARVFTGGLVPVGSTSVIKREWVDEAGGVIRFRKNAVQDVLTGANIRRRGENARAGDLLSEPGRVINPAVVTTLASNACSSVQVFRRVRVGIAVTGNELASASTSAQSEAQVRDSNGPSLRALLSTAPWCEVVDVVNVPDRLEATDSTLKRLSEKCDAVVTTGGISMGDHDYVPDALLALGAEVIYHHLAMRPGKPNLGAVLPGELPVIALPGNPVSALVGAVVLAGDVLRKLAGIEHIDTRPRHAVAPGPVARRPAEFWHYVPAALTEPGSLRPVEHRGSGDVAAIGRSDGCFELPAHAAADEPEARRWFPWSLAR